MKQKDPLSGMLNMLDLPAEMSPANSKLILTGSHDLLVYNHSGILVYEPERILFRRGGGAVAVFGEALTLSELTKEGLRINGHIRGIRLKESAHENR